MAERDKTTVPSETTRPEDEQVPVFDRAQDDLPWPQEDTLNADSEGNVLPGNDPLDEDPTDNGDQEQFDPEDIARKRALGSPLKP
ncbi:hypothetical protein [Pseudorhodobacter sp. MZDSW-24AT]|uniref:hypothetical protein n=1 Tax=Pseudorhodobacter sp. MZDSW-24AT TaxID=2052957 RepID=UPI000C1E074D|nr:hypothetical protein [Pseudorhodobacter sp. MZDSW-24AT]PJF07999.1 hypothetical protein CUR21_17500 [Pseudorhodobacter sp. MZDSW-24AT]